MSVDLSEKIIDITFLVWRFLRKNKSTGIDRVALAYVKQYRAQSSALIRYKGRWIFFDKNDSQALFDILFSEYSFYLEMKIRWIVTKSCWLFKSAKKGSVLFYISHGGFDNDNFLKKATQYNLNIFYFLHDLIPIDYPEYNRIDEDKKHHQRIEIILKTGCGLMVNSYETRLSFLNYIEQRKLKSLPFVTVPYGVDAEKYSEKRPISSPYFVILGTIEPRKNHLLLLNIWRRMVSEKLSIIPKLVIIGKRGWECEQVIDMLDRCAVIKEHIIELNQCDDAAVSNYLCHSQALLFPTFAEGYGLPLVEALSLGVPVIASSLPVFREIANDIPEYLDPIDGIGWHHMIIKYMNNDSSERKNQLERIKYYKPFTWCNHFKIVDNFIDNHVSK